jgi:hypothetical protein
MIELILVSKIVPPSLWQAGLWFSILKEVEIVWLLNEKLGPVAERSKAYAASLNLRRHMYGSQSF